MRLKFSILKKQLLLNFLLPLCVFFFVGLTLFYSVRGIVLGKAIQENEARTNQMRDSLESVLTEKISAIQTISLIPEIVAVSTALPEVLGNSDYERSDINAAVRILTVCSKNMNNNLIRLISFNSPFALSNEGVEEVPPIDYRESDWYHGASSTGTTYVSEEIRINDLEMEVITLAYPIYTGAKVSGAISIEIPVEEVFKILRDSAEFYGIGVSVISEKTGDFLWVSGSNGESIKDLKELKTELVPLYGKESQLIIDGITSYRTQQFEGQKENGSTLLYQSVPVSLLSWDILVSSSKTAVIESVISAILIPFLSALVIFSLVMLLGLIVTYRAIAKPLHNTIDNLDELSKGEGDLTVRLPAHDRDETGLLAEKFNDFVIKLQEIMINVQGNADSVQSVKEDIVANSQETASATHEISRNVDTIDKQVKDLNEEIAKVNSSILDINGSVNTLENTSAKQNDAFQQSSAAIEEMIAQLNSVASVINEKKTSASLLEETIQKSKESIENASQANHEILQIADEISNMSNIISGIASQTNLLSMNAAIEAAHAGDAGRGFSVVADEIRKLAESSSQNSSSINSLIKNVLQKVDQAVSAAEINKETFQVLMEEIRSTISALDEINYSTQELTKGGEQILDANKDFKQLYESVNEVNDIIVDSVKNVTLASSQVTDISENVTRGIGEISVGTTQISEAMNVVQDLSQQLSNHSNELESETNKFKTKEGE